jgi:hypothetical protein
MTVPQEWLNLSKTLILTPGIKISRVGAKRLYTLYTQGKTYTLMQEVGGKKEILAFGALWPTMDKKWLEIGTIFVSEQVAGKGISNLIVRSLRDLASSLQKHVLLVTLNSKIIAVATGLDFTKDSTNHPFICAKALPKNRNLKEGRELFYSLCTH